MAVVAGVVLMALAALAWWLVGGADRDAGRAERFRPLTRSQQERQYLFEHLQPVKLANCELERFGEPHDGGYLLCGNLLDAVASAYSYGISGYDQWGCDVSKKAGVRVHQYDCFNPTRPACPGGDTQFHDECIAGEAFVEEGRVFDTLENQFVKNGDEGKAVVVKMDVEGAEWDSLYKTPDHVLDRIAQLAVEFHGMDEGRYILTVLRLKEFFHVANLHFNNFTCQPGLEPFPAPVYEVLFVNKRIGEIDSDGVALRPHPLDAPNHPGWPDCQGEP
jgi:hypothetical protein